MISKRVQGFTESVIREMTRVNAEHGGVNLAQGFPNFPPPKELVEAAHRALDGDFHQYAITWGARNLREAIAAKFERFYGLRIDPERQVTVCCGSTEAMLATLLAVVDPGDEVVIFEPFYENYGPGSIISGAKPVFVPLEPPDFSFDPDRLAAAFTPRTRAIVFNSPNNPTGKVFSLRELEVIAELCQRHDVIAITDEIYEHMVYDGLRHIPIATLPGMADRTVTISGISKSYSVTGWRIGYTISSPEIAVGIRRAHDFVTVGAPAPLQEAAVTALHLPDSYYVELREAYQARRRQIRAEKRPESEMEALFREEEKRSTALLGPHNGKVGAFEGAMYEATGYYRPQADCIMFTRDDVGFCAVCRHALTRVIDQYTRP